MSSLTRNSTEKITLLSGRIVHVPKCVTTFHQWLGHPVPDYGGKTLLSLGGRPLFADIVVLKLLENEGWHGVWVDSFSGKYRIHMLGSRDPVKLPKKQTYFLWKIGVKAKAVRRGGCFDVFAWRGSRHRFVELKRHGKDRIRKSQKEWIAAAIGSGIKMSDLLIVEWNLAQGNRDS
jgi:hypothetical protein